MKCRLILPVALAVCSLSWTGNARAFDTFRLVADAVVKDEAVLHDAIQHGATQHGAIQREGIKHDHGVAQHDRGVVKLDRGAIQHHGAIKIDRSPVQYETIKVDPGAAQHDGIEYRATQHGAVQHGGAYQKCGATQKCGVAQKGCTQKACTQKACTQKACTQKACTQKACTQKACVAPKCGIIQKLGWSHHLGMAQKGCGEPKGGSKGCAPHSCHLHATACKMKCAARNLHDRMKEHCDSLKARLCQPKCCCETQCNCGECYGEAMYEGEIYDAEKYEGDTYDIIIDEKLDIEE